MSEFPVFVVEKVAPGVLKERSGSGEMVIFQVNDGSKQTIAAWAKAVEAELIAWPGGYPCLLLHDLRKSGILAFGAEMQADFERLFHLRPDLKRSVALVMPSNDSLDIARLDCMMRNLSAANNYPVTWEVFARRKQALAWLYSRVV